MRRISAPLGDELGGAFLGGRMRLHLPRTSLLDALAIGTVVYPLVAGLVSRLIVMDRVGLMCFMFVPLFTFEAIVILLARKHLYD